MWAHAVYKGSSSSLAAEQHMAWMESIEDAGVSDQLDLWDLLFVERDFRAVMTIEFQERKRQNPGMEFSEQTLAISNVEKGLLLGNRHNRGSWMIPPEFSAWLSSELKIEGGQQKAFRKLREELAAERERLRKGGNNKKEKEDAPPAGVKKGKG